MSNRKKRVYESEMPWYKGEITARSGNGDRNKAETHGLLDVFSKDYNFTRK
jgi:hypothetical protein